MQERSGYRFSLQQDIDYEDNASESEDEDDDLVGAEQRQTKMEQE